MNSRTYISKRVLGVSLTLGAFMCRETEALVLQHPMTSDQGFSFSFQTESNASYTAQVAVSLNSPINWQTLTNLSGNGMAATVIHRNIVARHGFYRVVGSNSSGRFCSTNALGYVRVTVNKNPASESTLLMIANPLNAGRNTVSEVLPAVPDGTLLFTFNNGTSQFDSGVTFAFGAWDVPNHPFAPGAGGFLVFDNASIGSSATITFVGEVPQGVLNTPIPNGRVAVLASKAPLAGGLNGDLGFPAADGDVVFQWSKATYSYADGKTFAFGSWDVAPILGVAEGFAFISDPVGAFRSWTRDFRIPCEP